MGCCNSVVAFVLVVLIFVGAFTLINLVLKWVDWLGAACKAVDYEIDELRDRVSKLEAKFKDGE